MFFNKKKATFVYNQLIFSLSIKCSEIFSYNGTIEVLRLLKCLSKTYIQFILYINGRQPFIRKGSDIMKKNSTLKEKKSTLDHVYYEIVRREVVQSTQSKKKVHLSKFIIKKLSLILQY